MSNAEIIRSLKEAMSAKQTPMPYDAPAVVTRIEGNATAWVKIAGSDTETPVKLTIDAKAGDTVQVRVGGGSAWLTGNQSAPPTDNTKAQEAIVKAREAGGTATKYITADSTSGIKVHAEANPTTNYAQIDETGMSIYQGVDRVATKVAEFKASGVRIGKDGAANVKVASDKVTISGPDGQAALIASYESIIDDQGNVKYGTDLKREDSSGFISLLPSTTPDEFGQYTMSYWACMNDFVWQLIAGWYMQFDDTVFSVYSANSDLGIQLSLSTGLFTSHKGFATDNGYTDIVEYEDVPLTVSFEAGTIGTRAASLSVGSIVKSGYTYIGAYVADHRNTSYFSATIAHNDPNNTAHLCVYRATGNAVTDAEVTVRKVWLKTGTEV